MLPQHREKRIACLVKHEEEKHQILHTYNKVINQKSSDDDKTEAFENCEGDPLLYNFRFDEICFALRDFKNKGIDLDTLLEFQNNADGAVIYRWNSEYNTLRFGVNKIFNVFPLIIVMCETDNDVVQAYKFARKYKIKISLRSGGHSFLGTSLTTGMIIDQSRRTKIRISNDAEYVIASSGVLLGPLALALFEYKKMIPSGSCPNVSQCGYSLLGGISSYTRYFGTGSDNIKKAKLMLANGQIVIAENSDKYIEIEADENNKSRRIKSKDLLWAVKGGGASFGVSLEIMYKTHSIDLVYRFKVSYEIKDLPEALDNWFKFIKNEAVTSDFIGRKGTIFIFGYYLGSSEEKLKKYLKPILNNNISVEITRMTYLEGMRQSAKNGRWNHFFEVTNGFVDTPFPLQASRVLQKFLCKANEKEYFIFDNLGGVNDKISSSSSAWVHRCHLCWFHMVFKFDNQKETVEVTSRAAKYYKKLQPYLTFDVYQNAPIPEIDNPLERYYGENLSKLRKIKTIVDPENVIQFYQSIPPYDINEDPK